MTDSGDIGEALNFYVDPITLLNVSPRYDQQLDRRD